MQLGMIGLGRMGANMVRRLMRAGHSCIVYDVSADAVKTMEVEGATGSSSLEDFVRKLEPPRPVWMMIPAALVDDMIGSLASDVAGRCRSHTTSNRAIAGSPTIELPYCKSL